jgi:hypothetical protein
MACIISELAEIIVAGVASKVCDHLSVRTDPLTFRSIRAGWAAFYRSCGQPPNCPSILYLNTSFSDKLTSAASRGPERSLRPYPVPRPFARPALARRVFF